MATNHNITITADASSANKGISKVDKGLGGLTASAGKFKAAIGIAAAAMGAMAVAGKIQDTIDSFDNLAKSARAAGSWGPRLITGVQTSLASTPLRLRVRVLAWPCSFQSWFVRVVPVLT